MSIAQRTYCKTPDCDFSIIISTQTDIPQVIIDQETHLEQNKEHKLGVELIWQEPSDLSPPTE